jgi:5-methylcytosine-specific restriction protein A
MPRKICIEAACSNYASGPGGRCDEHRKRVERERSRRRREKTKGVYGKRMWRMRRKQAIERQPLCPGDGIDPCLYGAVVEEVDHVVPLSEAPELAYTSSNHVARCSRCHWRKTARENSR